MANYTPEFVAHVRRRYEDTDDTLAAIALDCGISERTLNRMRDREGWQRRGDREPRGISPAMRLRDETIALLAARATSTANAAAGSAKQSVPTAADGNELHRPPTPDPSPPPAAPANGEAPAVLLSMIDRIERLVERELAAEEAVRTQLGALPRSRSEAERTARTIAALLQTIEAVQRLRRGETDCGFDDNDDMPRDIDAFRYELARRIDAFVASRLHHTDAAGECQPASVDGAQ